MRTLILGCLLVALFCSCASFAAENTSSADQSYKATTVDECIQEKECVWHHFLLAIQAEPIKQEKTDNVNIRKWLKPIRIRVIGELEKLSTSRFDYYLSQVIPYMSHDVTVNQKYNYLIVITDSIEHELSVNFRDAFHDTFGSDVVLKAYKEGAKIRADKCHYLHMQDTDHQNNIYSYFAFIEKSNPDIEECLKEVVYVGTGLADISYSPLLKRYKGSGPYSKLQLILINFLYQDYFRGGMSVEQVRQVFDQIYDPLIQSLKKQGAFDDN